MWADNLRTFSVFAVVILHVAAGFVSGIDTSDPMYGNYTWWAGNIYDSIMRWCVPSFVIISGYFLLNKNESNKIFFQKRLRKIFIPLLFWSLFFSFWVILKSIVKDDVSSGFTTVAKGWILGRPYYHLWYLFMIPFLYIITPVLRLIFKNASRIEIFMFIILCFSLAILNTIFANIISILDVVSKEKLFTNTFLSYIGYFCFGGYVAKFNINIKNNLCLLILFSSWLVTIFGSYFFTYSYFYSYLSINTVLASIAIFFLVKNFFNRELGLSNFSKLSFGIYLIHPVFIDAITFSSKSWLLSKVDVYLYIPIVGLVVFLLSYITVLVMSKIVFLRKCV